MYGKVECSMARDWLGKKEKKKKRYVDGVKK